MPSRTLTACATAVGAGAVLFGVLAAAGMDEPEPRVRIGVYDNRAVAIAWGNSEFNPVKERMGEYRKAQAEGDEAKIKELEAWGVSLQRKLHFQGFGRYPVDDLLGSVSDQLAGVAEAKHLDAIAWFTDFERDGVEIVDITPELVALFGPNEKAQNWIEQLKETEPVGLEELVKMSVND